MFCFYSHHFVRPVIITKYIRVSSYSFSSLLSRPSCLLITTSSFNYRKCYHGETNLISVTVLSFYTHFADIFSHCKISFASAESGHIFPYYLHSASIKFFVKLFRNFQFISGYFSIFCTRVVIISYILLGFGKRKRAQDNLSLWCLNPI